MERRYGLGLRAQILIVLSAAFALSFTGLGVVVMQVTKRAQQIEHERRSSATAETLAVALDGTTARSQPAQASLARLIGRANVIGISVAPPDGDAVRFGETRDSPDALASLANGDRLGVWTLPMDPHATGVLSSLLRLYLFLTGAFILLIAYVVLTRLIVRPVENLTRAAERLGSGKVHDEVPVAGAAEVASLAVRFNRMARELRGERSALETRLGELERATSELRATQDHLIRSEKLASVGRLSAGIAHEIGNPLAAILGLVELLQMGGLDGAEQAEFLRRIRSETERIHRIIRELLAYSRNQPEAAPPAACADLVEVVEHAVKLLTPQQDLRRIDIERRFESDSLWVRGSADELSQIALNLLLNATDAIAGEGKILVAVSTESETDSVVLTVTDTGPGIPHAVRDKLFEPFVTTKAPGKGTGLGLAVCQALVQRYGGSIQAGNDSHGGARFVVKLKASPAALE